jgi:hypothetical protein
MKVKVKTPKEILGVDVVSFKDKDGYIYPELLRDIAVSGEALPAVIDGVGYRLTSGVRFYLKPEWCEVVEPGWDDVPVDTKILVRSSNTKPWEKRHFAKFENDTVYAWIDGKTSFTVVNTTVDTMCWQHAKLAE